MNSSAHESMVGIYYVVQENASMAPAALRRRHTHQETQDTHAAATVRRECRLCVLYVGLQGTR